MSRNDGFLSRWSRRKLDRLTDEPEIPAAREAEPNGPDATLARPAAPGPTLPAELPEEELAALPRIEDLTAETELAPFLKAGVPALLRKAALRRMWALDPAIRDFVGEARDYSYDWNVVGGVPVSGPLLPGDDVEATLGRMFSRLKGDPESAEAPAGGAGCAVEANEVAEGVIDPDASRPAGEAGRAEPPGLLEEAVTPAGEDAAVASSGAASPLISAGARAAPSDLPLAGRRHGAATPKFD